MPEIWRLLWLVALALGLMSTAQAARYQAYPTGIVALDMDSGGIVVGWREDVDGSRRAAVRRYQPPQDPQTPGSIGAPVIDEPPDAVDSVVTAIADGGSPQLLAGYYRAADGVLRPLIWPWGNTIEDPSDPIVLPSLAEGEDAVALGVNWNHLVVGWARDVDGLEYPVYWLQGPSNPDDPENSELVWKISPLPLPPGALGGRATGVSPSDRVGGYAVTSDGVGRVALMWEAEALDAQPTALLDPDGNPAEITDLSGSFLSGWSGSEGNERALRWRSLFGLGEQADTLADLGGGKARALAVNARGETVGWAVDGEGRSRAFIYSDLCATFDLNRLLSISDPFPLSEVAALTEAHAVDEQSPPWITALGEDEASYLLVPVKSDPVTLSLRVSADRPRVRVGEPLNYTIEVENSGDSYATCVVVTSELYIGETLLGVEMPGGQCFAGVEQAYCVVDELLPGERVQMRVRTMPRPILVDREIINRVRVFSGEASDVQEVETRTPVPREGCFIATAAYGSFLAPEVEALRAFRDRWLQPYLPGVVDFYYRHSPPLAQWLQAHPAALPWVRGLLAPLVYTVAHPGAALVVGLAAIVLLGGMRHRRGDQGRQ